MTKEQCIAAIVAGAPAQIAFGCFAIAVTAALLVALQQALSPEYFQQVASIERFKVQYIRQLSRCGVLLQVLEQVDRQCDMQGIGSEACQLQVPARL